MPPSDYIGTRELGGNGTAGARRSFAVALILTVLVLLLYADVSLLPEFDLTSCTSSPQFIPARRKYAVAHYVESLDQLYGVYAIHNQMIKNNMTLTYIADGVRLNGDVSHVVITPTTMEKNHSEVLRQWIGEENIRVVDQAPLRDKLVDSGMWAETFSKLCIFNLTEFDKIIMFDTDMLVRTNLMHWFEYPTPCGAQQKGDFAWNSGAMVIEPSRHVFDLMMHQLPNVKRYNTAHKYGKDDDPLNAGYSDQDFITAFFVNQTNDAKSRCVFPAEASILSSVLPDDRWDYLNKHRPFIYQTVHFTTDKPWRGFQSKDPMVCSMLREWYDSVDGIDKYYEIIPPMENTYDNHCGD